MFGSNTKDSKSNSSTASAFNEKDSAATTVIAKGTTIEGKFACGENVRLDGAIHGEVKVDKRFVMGDGSYVQGNIIALNAAIKGKIKGDIHVKEALHLMDTAVIEGNISAKTMVVDEGARYNGSCRIGNAAPAASTPIAVTEKN
ncbi:MAG: polymer-forming cytoskeletal protein [Phycisphaerae bacterium]|nr:polymer-forming cytoskeletal protein [Saprospiraceae bacterium]